VDLGRFLAIAVDAAHALLQAAGVPGDVVVDHHAATLEVDTQPEAECIAGEADVATVGARGAGDVLPLAPRRRPIQL